MSRIRYLADEDLRRRIVRTCLKIEPGIEFLTVQEVGLSSADDDQVLEFAASQGLATVSHDKRTMVPAAINRLTSDLPMTGLFIVTQKAPVKYVAENLVIIWACDDAERWHSRIEYLPWT